MAATGFTDHQGVDIGLADGVSALRLADVNAPGITPALRQNLFWNKAIVDDDVGFLERAEGAQGEEIGGAGAGPDKGDMPVEIGIYFQGTQRISLGVAGIAGKNFLSDRPGEEARPETAALINR